MIDIYFVFKLNPVSLAETGLIFEKKGKDKVMAISKDLTGVWMKELFTLPKTVATAWEVYIYLLWRDNILVDSLEQILQKYRVKNILDCCGGTGFPSLELCRRGWDVTYADGNEAMHSMFVKKMTRADITMPHHTVWWQNLLTQFALNSFDALLCRGNSLPYANSWQRQCSSFSNAGVKASLQNFWQALKPDGVLYVDTANQQEFELDESEFPLERMAGNKKIGSHEVSLSWSIRHLRELKMRIWTNRLMIDGETYTFSEFAYLLSPEELRGLLGEVGFKVTPVTLDGENCYTTFIATKLEQKEMVK